MSREAVQSGTESRVTVDLGDRSYDIHIGDNLVATAGERIQAIAGTRRLIVITDETVAPHHLPALEASLTASGHGTEVIQVPPGEASKSFESLSRVLTTMLAAGIDRRAMVVALGGGVIGDLAGVAAALALRGLDFIQIPTTLLAQVDSSVGGKTGINTPQGKNLVGAFHQPRLVLCDTGVLDTLPRREVLAGYAEVVKYGFLGDADFFEWLERFGADVINGDPAARREAVRRSCLAKAGIVAADERESGQRALLNFGHTFAHAFEAEAGYDGSVLHGEAVAVGMAHAFALSVRAGLCSGQDAVRATTHLNRLGLPTTRGEIGGGTWDADALMRHMAKDKKVVDGTIRFIVANAIGDTFVTDEISRSDARGVLMDLKDAAAPAETA